MRKTPGGTLIFVVSILYIIFGIIAALGLGASAALLAYVGMMGAMGGLFIVSFVVSIIIVAFEIISGIYGVRFANDLSKANTIFRFGLVLLIIAIVNIILGAILSSSTGEAIDWTSFVSLVLPILYFIGGNMNRKALGAG